MVYVPRTAQEHADLFTQTGTIGLDFTATKEKRIEANQEAGPVETTLRLIAAGYVGKGLNDQLLSVHTRDELKAHMPSIRKIRAKFEGVVGRIVHMPLWFSNCREAASALTANTQKDASIVLKEMSKCGSCSLRTGSTCTLMKKQFAHKLEPVALRIVSSRVASAVKQAEISKEEGQKILSSIDSSVKKIQQLNKMRRHAGAMQPTSMDGLIDYQIKPSSEGLDKMTMPRTAKKVDADVNRVFNTDTAIPTLPRDKTASKQNPVQAKKTYGESVVTTAIKVLASKPARYWSTDEGMRKASSLLASFEELGLNGFDIGPKGKNVQASLQRIAQRMPQES